MSAVVDALTEVLDDTIPDYPIGATVCRTAAEAVVAAIRSMPAEQVAELIGGEVGYWTFYPSGAPYAEIHPQGDYAPERIAARHVKEGTHVERRVQGPWLPTSPAVLGLRKIEPEPKEQ